MVNYKLFQAGHCTQCEKIARKNGELKKATFPMIVGYIEYGNEKVLFDTGYSQHFKECTSSFPEKMYDLLVPVTLAQEENIYNILKKEGIEPESITKIILSHFHADHIAGVRLFENAEFVCSKEGWDDFNSKGRLSAIREGYLHGLLPNDFEDKAHFFENLETVTESLFKDLKHSVQPLDYERPVNFRSAYWLDKENGIAIVELPGHKKGHFGLYIQPLNTLFAADACWRRETYINLDEPNFIGMSIQENKKDYRETIQLLSDIYYRYGVNIILCHCLDSYQDYLNEKA